ncbi:MAG: site-specific recombinase resolvase [Xanthomonadaceae bacterium]|nr:site-specific recombinase resolvase [Xanthomonadaceae bacterium]
MKIRQNGEPVHLEDRKMTTLIPVKIKWHGGRKKVIPAVTLPDQQPEHDASMLVALSRAYHWQRLLDTGVVDSGSDIARREGLHQTTVNALLRLTQLSPTLVRDILNGRQPKTLSMRWLKTHELPWEWGEQQEFFGRFDA